MKYPKLPKAFKRKWVAALRSGKYRQTKEFLYDGDGFCCLGVACRVQRIGLLKINGEHFVPKALPRIPSALVGEGDENALVQSLASKNDSGRWPFKRIADWIEKYL